MEGYFRLAESGTGLDMKYGEVKGKINKIENTICILDPVRIKSEFVQRSEFLDRFRRNINKLHEPINYNEWK